MNIVISFQNFDTSETLKEYINKKIAKLIKFNDKLIQATVHLNFKKGIHTSNINIRGLHKTDLIAEAKDGGTIYSAFDKSLEKIKKQLTQLK